MQTILIIEDDTAINHMTAEFLQDNGYLCRQAFSGTEGLLLFQLHSIDLIIMDLMLPGIDGKELLTQIRQISRVPVIILSALTDTRDKVALLSLGADDYLGKPFVFSELLARIQVQERHASRASSHAENVCDYRSWHIDSDSRTLFVDGSSVSLTLHEFDIIALLSGRPKKVFTKQEIYELVWGEESFIEDKTINVHISNIRAKLRASGTDGYIRTVWGIGFTLS